MTAVPSKLTKTIDGIPFPAEAFAYTPDFAKSQTWELCLFDSVKDVPDRPSVSKTAGAVLALSPSFAGATVTIPAMSVYSVTTKVADAWKTARNSNCVPSILGLEKLAVPQVDKADVSTGDLASDGGLLKPAQGHRFGVQKLPDAKFAVIDSTNGKTMSLHPKKTEAFTEAKRRNGLSKAADDAAPALEFKILKAEGITKAPDQPEEERTVFGIVLEPEVIDSQKDIYSDVEVRKTAYRFMERYQQFGLMHQQIIPSILPLESYLAPVDFVIGKQAVKKGTWLLRVRVLNDVIWKQVKTGKITGFSIGGSAISTPDKVITAAAKPELVAA